jgi:hypothetical protein
MYKIIIFRIRFQWENNGVAWVCFLERGTSEFRMTLYASQGAANVTTSGCRLREFHLLEIAGLRLDSTCLNYCWGRDQQEDVWMFPSKATATITT